MDSRVVPKHLSREAHIQETANFFHLYRFRLYLYYKSEKHVETHHLKNLARLKVKVHLYPTRVTEPFEVAFVLGKNTAIKLFRPFLINLVQGIWNVTKCRKVACPEAKRRLTGTASGRFES